MDQSHRYAASPGVQHERPSRVMLTLLFTDVVGSTRWALKLGDRRWAELLDAHQAAVRAKLASYEGREVDSVGDSFLAAFDRAVQAVRCARAVVREVRRLELELRAGLHSGECELVRGRLRGVAVHTGARVVGLARPGEVLVSAAVRDLVGDGDVRFHDRGSHRLQDLPGRWRLFALDQEGVAPVPCRRPRHHRAATAVRRVRVR